MTLKDKIDKIKQLRDKVILEGCFTVFDTVNRNGPRYYPQDVFDREIKKLNEKA